MWSYVGARLWGYKKYIKECKKLATAGENADCFSGRGKSVGHWPWLTGSAGGGEGTWLLQQGEEREGSRSTSTLPSSPPEKATQVWGLHQGSSAALWDNTWESRSVKRQERSWDGGVDRGRETRRVQWYEAESWSSLAVHRSPISSCPAGGQRACWWGPWEDEAVPFEAVSVL